MTGGGTGIGAATAIAFAREGATVVVAGRRLEPLEQIVDQIAAAGGTAFAVTGDVGRAQDVHDLAAAAMEKAGGVDVLVNNAGQELVANTVDTTEDWWDRVLDTNLKSIYLLGRELLAPDAGEPPRIGDQRRVPAWVRGCEELRGIHRLEGWGDQPHAQHGSRLCRPGCTRQRTLSRGGRHAPLAAAVRRPLRTAGHDREPRPAAPHGAPGSARRNRTRGGISRLRRVVVHDRRGAGNRRRIHRVVSSLLIRGGRVVNADSDVVADVLVEGETITRIGPAIEHPADRVIDATGCYVLPGMVDPHTHLETPASGTVTVDDFTSGSIAAAFGGTTTLLHFCVPAKGEDFSDTLAAWHDRLALHPPVVDVGFHMFVTDLGGDRSLEQLALLPDAGVTTFKVFMAYKDDLMLDDAALFETMRVAADTGAVVMVHAENGDIVELLRREAVAAGHTEPYWHARTRPPATEAEATNRAIELAHLAGAPLYVVHVSCGESLQPIVRAHAEGWDVAAETCTHYLLLDETAIEQDSWDAAGFVYSPPPRARHNQEVLWAALAAGELTVVSSDHNAFSLHEQKTMGRDDFSQIPNGAPGIEDRLRLIHEFGVRAGRISLSRMVELLATAPARQFGLFPRKGTIAVGSDGDIVVFDPDRRVTISASTQRSLADYNLYEGTEVVGSPTAVILRGQIVVEDDRLVASPGLGRFIPQSAGRRDARDLRGRATGA